MYAIDPDSTMSIDALNVMIHQWIVGYAETTRRDNGIPREDYTYGYRAMLDEPSEVEADFSASLGRKPDPAEVEAMWQAVREAVSQ